MHFYDMGQPIPFEEWCRIQRRRLRLQMQEPGGRGYAVTTRRNGQSSTVHLDDMPDVLKDRGSEVSARKRFL